MLDGTYITPLIAVPHVNFLYWTLQQLQHFPTVLAARKEYGIWNFFSVGISQSGFALASRAIFVLEFGISLLLNFSLGFGIFRFGIPSLA